MPDVAAAVKHYRYAPKDGEGNDLPPGTYQTPFFGEVVVGEVIAVTGDRIARAEADSNFEKASQKQYDNQPSHVEQVEALQRPYIGEED